MVITDSNNETDAQNVQNAINDPLHLASSDHPGMTLTNKPFNGSNFLGCSRTIKMALGSKLKLGFIDGTLSKPAIIDATFPRWTRCDYMVTWWILNSMVAELSESFLELNKVNQGNMIVATYYNKLKRFWDELQSLNGIPTCSCGKMRDCTCGIVEKFLEIESRSKLIQFLMKLNDEFESVRSQILSMDPLPSINKAYYIVQQVEKQKQVTKHEYNPTAFFANNNKNGASFSNNKNGNNFKKIWRDNSDKKCTHCNMEGHTFDQCFEKIGYPDWYKGKKGKKNNRMAAQVLTDFGEYIQKDTPFGKEFENDMDNEKVELDQKLVNVVCQEMWKMFKGKGEDVASTSKSYAGISFQASIKVLTDLHKDFNAKSDWIVDTGASDHISPYIHLFQSIRDLSTPIRVKLPDGNSKWVTKVGTVQITPNLIISDVFFVPK
ncbi:uncharacterized protein [Rutidosis leptorrhynchoides]|uniref:uncharacterized protein n=1 Tax=Rutidosis leptorrhynchoides TaxID=125765 RepID=UPI003A99E755